MLRISFPFTPVAAPRGISHTATMTWDRIRGHDRARLQLQMAYRHQRLAHAYLFVGPPGIGKHLFAREVAKALLCESPPAAFTACDRCPACLQVVAHTHPDCKHAAKPEDKAEFPIDTIRELCDELSQRPIRGSRKIAIVDDADDFNEEAANAFLKMLEEPPTGSLLILISTSTDRQLPTILSRCQLVKFQPLADDDIQAILAEQGVEEPNQRMQLARMAGGSVARALALNDPALGEFRQFLLNELTAARPDSLAISQRWIPFAEEAGSSGAEQRARTDAIVHVMLDLFRAALRVSLGATESASDARENAAIRTLAAQGPERLMESMDAALAAELNNQRRLQLALLIEQLADRWTARPATR
jgi:DNA polymerase-3 subunit delta'